MTPKSKKNSHTFWEKLDPFTYVDDWIIPKLNPGNNEYINWAIYIVFSFVFAFLLYSFFGLILQTHSPLVIVVSGSMLPTMARGDVVILQGIAPESLNVQEMVLDGVDVGNSSPTELAEYTPDGQGGWDIRFKANQQLVNVPKQGTSDIVVYVSTYKKLEIIHRAVVKIRSNGEYFLLTKGDNNPNLDQDCGDVTEFLVPGGGLQLTTDKSCPSPYPIPISQVNGKALFWIPYLGYVKLLLVDSVQNGFV